MGSVVAVLAALAPARETSACGNEVELALTPAKLVAEAERLVAEGRVQAAHDRIAAIVTVPNPELGQNPLLDRALIVGALVVVRSDGALPMPRAAAKGERKEAQKEGADTDRVARLKEAVAILEKVVATSKWSPPATEADVGEALARIPGREADAKKILEPLEAKAIVASPWAYAALGQLRFRTDADRPAWLAAATLAAEQPARTMSLERCAKMTKRKEICAGKLPDDAMKKEPFPRSVRVRHPWALD